MADAVTYTLSGGGRFPPQRKAPAAPAGTRYFPGICLVFRYRVVPASNAGTTQSSFSAKRLHIPVPGLFSAIRCNRLCFVTNLFFTLQQNRILYICHRSTWSRIPPARRPARNGVGCYSFASSSDNHTKCSCCRKRESDHPFYYGASQVSFACLCACTG